MKSLFFRPRVNLRNEFFDDFLYLGHIVPLRNNESYDNTANKPKHN